LVRALTVVFLCSVFVCSVVLCGECEAAKKTHWPFIWRAPDSSWAVGGFGKLRPGLLEEILEKKPAELDGLKAYELQAREPGEWWGFSVGLKKVDRVVFTKSTKFVVTGKNGRRVESEAIIFYPDYLQTSLYDSRKSPVIVSKSSVWCNPSSGDPSGKVKFPRGSIELENVASFEVIGAIVDTTQRVAR